MTTKEFIKMLKEADPEGNSHIRIDGEVPQFAILKEGYWDGPYNYINEKGQWVHSTKGNKVDIYSKSREDIVYEVVNNWNPFIESSEGLWEKVKEKFVFELGYIHNNDRIESFMNNIKENYDYWLEYRKKSWNDHLEKVIEINNRGCRFFQKKDSSNSKMKYYEGWHFINEKNPKDIGSACLMYTYVILKSGKFKSIETDHFPNNEYYEYIQM